MFKLITRSYFTTPLPTAKCVRYCAPVCYGRSLTWLAQPGGGQELQKNVFFFFFCLSFVGIGGGGWQTYKSWWMARGIVQFNGKPISDRGCCYKSQPHKRIRCNNSKSGMACHFKPGVFQMKALTLLQRHCTRQNIHVKSREQDVLINPSS